MSHPNYCISKFMQASYTKSAHSALNKSRRGTQSVETAKKIYLFGQNNFNPLISRQMVIRGELVYCGFLFSFFYFNDFPRTHVWGCNTEAHWVAASAASIWEETSPANIMDCGQALKPPNHIRHRNTSQLHCQMGATMLRPDGKTLAGALQMKVSHPLVM